MKGGSGWSAGATVLARTLARERRPAVGWIAGMAALVLVTTGSWPAIARSSSDFEDLLDNLPDALTAFFGEGIGHFSAAAVVGSRLYGTIGLALVIGYAVSRGARAIAGEEAGGTLELVVTQPITRSAFAVAKVIGAWTSLAALVGAELLLLLVMMPIVGLTFPPAAVVGAALGLYLVGALFGMLAFAVGAATGNRALAVAAGAGSAAALFLLTGLGGLVEGLAGLAELSPFSAYDGSTVLSDGLPAVPAAMFGLASVALVAAGIWRFDRRDLT